MKKEIEAMAKTGLNRTGIFLGVIDDDFFGGGFFFFSSLRNDSRWWWWSSFSSWSLIKSPSLMEDRLWMDDRTVGDERSNDDWVRVSFAWLFWPSIPLLLSFFFSLLGPTPKLREPSD